MKHLNLMAPIGYTGYGIAGMNILKALVRSGVDTTLFYLGNPNVDNEEDKRIVEAAIKKQETFDNDAPCLKIWHQFDLAQRIGHKVYAAFPFFELDKFNEKEIRNLRCADYVLATSAWAKSILDPVMVHGYNSCYVVPLGVDLNIFSNEAFIADMAANRRFRGDDYQKQFVILNVGKWEKRKGHDIIPDIFSKAFGPKDDVALHMLPHNPFLSKEETLAWEKKYYSCAMGHRIQILPRVNTHKELARLMAGTNIGFFPSHAEGWNLELLEMMALGKHVIATNYSAHTEFCNENNATLIEITENETAQDGKWFFGQGDWAHFGESQQEAMIEGLRAAYKKWQDNPAGFINLAGVATAQKYTWQNTAEKIIEHLY